MAQHNRSEDQSICKQHNASTNLPETNDEMRYICESHPDRKLAIHPKKRLRRDGNTDARAPRGLLFEMLTILFLLKVFLWLLQNKFRYSEECACHNLSSVRDMP